MKKDKIYLINADSFSVNGNPNSKLKKDAVCYEFKKSGGSHCSYKDKE